MLGMNSKQPRVQDFKTYTDYQRAWRQANKEHVIDRTKKWTEGNSIRRKFIYHYGILGHVHQEE